MTHTSEHLIAIAEQRLRQAMLTSDLLTLDELISPELVFTNHVGQILSKHSDLELHSSGTIHFQSLTPSEQQIKIHGDCAVVSVRMNVAGNFSGIAFNENFRYTRVWKNTQDQGWQIVAGHMSLVQE